MKIIGSIPSAKRVYRFLRRKIGRIKIAKNRTKDTTRFQKFSDREYLMEQALSIDLVSAIQRAKESTNNKAGLKWKGAGLCKDPFSVSMYLQLLQELKPKTIIEIGSWEGGSARWLYDMLKTIGVDTKVYSYDVTLERIKIKDTKNINFFEMDSFNIGKEFNIPEKIDRPLLVIEDAHVNVNEVLEFMDGLLIKGDYLIVEDSGYVGLVNPGSPRPIRGQINQIYLDMTEFMKNHSEDYLVDSYYTDHFGYNVSWHWNAILKKVK